MQEFLEQFGFRKTYCDLQVVYKTWLRWAVQAMHPFIPVIERLPDLGPIPQAKSLIQQEQIRRTFR
jgi:hypothetical protein